MLQQDIINKGYFTCKDIFSKHKLLQTNTSTDIMFNSEYNIMQINYFSRVVFCKKKRMEVDIMTGITTGDFKEFQIKNKMHLDANVILDMVQNIISILVLVCCH
jgi:hypothetical protein